MAIRVQRGVGWDPAVLTISRPADWQAVDGRKEEHALFTSGQRSRDQETGGLADRPGTGFVTSREYLESRGQKGRGRAALICRQRTREGQC